MIGVKLRTNVCNTNIHLPFCEVGENLQRPFEISWIEEEEAEKVLVPKIPEEESERKLIIRFFYIFWFQTQWPFIFTDEAHKVNAWRDFWSKISPKSLPELSYKFYFYICRIHWILDSQKTTLLKIKTPEFSINNNDLSQIVSKKAKITILFWSKIQKITILFVISI